MTTALDRERACAGNSMVGASTSMMSVSLLSLTVLAIARAPSCAFAFTAPETLWSKNAASLPKNLLRTHRVCGRSASVLSFLVVLLLLFANANFCFDGVLCFMQTSSNARASRYMTCLDFQSMFACT